MSDTNYREIIETQLPKIPWVIEDPAKRSLDNTVASYEWGNGIFVIFILVQSPRPPDEKCWTINMSFGWKGCDASVNVDLRGRGLKSVYDRAYEKFQRRIKTYMERKAKQLALIPKGKFPFENLIAQDALEISAARGLTDY